jgi:hypothetical protein
MRGEHALKVELPFKYADKPLRLKKKFSPTVPFYFPKFVLNKFTVKLLIFYTSINKEKK